VNMCECVGVISFADWSKRALHNLMLCGSVCCVNLWVWGCVECCVNMCECVGVISFADWSKACVKQAALSVAVGVDACGCAIWMCRCAVWIFVVGWLGDCMFRLKYLTIATKPQDGEKKEKLGYQEVHTPQLRNACFSSTNCT
jgi:hypothetical protein